MTMKRWWIVPIVCAGLVLEVWLYAAAADKPSLALPYSETSSAMTVLAPCLHSAEGCYIIINDEKGAELVRISERTGKVTLLHPELRDRAAQLFWQSIEAQFGTVCFKERNP
jgi:hypothetical protein